MRADEDSASSVMVNGADPMTRPALFSTFLS